MTTQPQDMTPSEIDAVLAENWTDQARARQRISAAADAIRRAAGQRRVGYGLEARWSGDLNEAIGRTHYEADNAEKDYERAGASRLLAELEERRTDLDALCAAAYPYEAEYSERGWTRYFLVANTGGHVHRERSCSTCFATTEFNWLPSLSGCDESAMVAEYGELGCTVCFPDAPSMSGFGDGTSALARYSAAEKAERVAAKAERAAAKAAKTFDPPFRVSRYGWAGDSTTELIETVHGAKTQLKKYVDDSAPGAWHGQQRMDEALVAREIATLTQALASKGIDAAPLIARWTKAAAR